MSDVFGNGTAANALPKIPLLGLTAEEVRDLLPEGVPSYTAKQIVSFCYDGKSVDEMTSLPKTLRASLSEKFVSVPLVVEKVYESRDGSKKFLFRFGDGSLAESVFMPHGYGNTVCLSTQIGCKMGCVFCASGMDGFKRNLLASEILGQAVAINRMEGGTAKERAVTNVVLMGSGEPLDNYDNVLRFLSDATRKDGINFSERNISLSTSGLCDRIRDLADSGFKITLSISLHGADDSIRSSIMPVNRRYGVKEVIGAARYYFERTGRRVIFEYILIDGVNDSRSDAVKLAALVKGFPAHINVIRYNEVDGKSMKSPSVRSTEDFVAGLNALGASATLRHSFGGDIEGACGQLKRRYTTEAGK